MVGIVVTVLVSEDLDVLGNVVSVEIVVELDGGLGKEIGTYFPG